MVYSLAVNHESPQQARARERLLLTDWLHLDTLRNERPSPFTVSKMRSGQLPASDGAPKTPQLQSSTFSSAGRQCWLHLAFQIPYFSYCFVFHSPWTLANFPTAFFNSGVRMALQGWVLIEESLNCSDMLRVYYPTINLVMFALGLDLWGNECPMKMHLNSLLCFLS